MSLLPSSLTTYHRACRSGLSVDVRLGSPDLRNCAGLGICSILLREEMPARPACPDGLPAYLRLEPVTGRLLLHLLTAAVTPFLHRRHFPDGCLTLPQDYALPRALTDALGLPEGPHDIAAGTYPILQDEVFVTCSFRLGAAHLQDGHLRRPAA
ncbi:hypothetical protein [Neolewinella litorea]|uniref:Uncharacterized protein n=1 Tax=Neolewinella litorea TaxID=2562452 RepID=A0A4S4NPT2_9BACT|nr:hypothetical protein [Neolewinella litorea]THH42074.1 hypothetical protein E4021_05695 [Neolewinella litorea]